MAFTPYTIPPRKPRPMMPPVVLFLLCMAVGWGWGILLRHANDPIPVQVNPTPAVQPKKEENGLQRLMSGKIKVPTKKEQSQSQK